MIRSRFAPSPSGRLHLGNARTALFAFLLARSDPEGAFIVRIEDTDRERSRREFEDSIREDLEWIGLMPDESPWRGGPHSPYRQSERHERYVQAVSALLKIGRAYPCYCTSEELESQRRAAQQRHVAPRYSGRCRDLSSDDLRNFEKEGRKPAIRFRAPDEDLKVRDALRGEILFRARELDDFIIQRSDGAVSFLLASALDDADMRITHVVRGDDHLPNLPKQILLLNALGRPAPEYAHLGLIQEQGGKPLSKREGASSLADLRALGYQPAAVIAAFARLGWNPPEPVAENLLNVFAMRFKLSEVSRSPCIWDLHRLDHENARVLRGLSLPALMKLAESHLPADIAAAPLLEKALAAVQPEIRLLSGIESLVRPLLPGDVGFDAEAVSAFADPDAGIPLAAFTAALEKQTPAETDAFPAALASAKDASGLSGRRLYHPLRAAMTGRTSGIELSAIFALLGPDEVRRRILRALEFIREKRDKG